MKLSSASQATSVVDNSTAVTNARFYRSAVVALLAMTVASCTSISGNGSAGETLKTSTVSTEAPSQPVVLSFAGEFSGQAFDCDSQYLHKGASDSLVTVSDFKVFVSRVRMLDAAGNETAVVLNDDGLWQQQNIALLDFENAGANCTNGTPQTNTTISGMVAPGQYTGIAFDIGVPFDMNHVDPTLAASPMNLSSMFWNWRGGYRFMRVDLAVVEETKGMKKTHESKKDMSSGHNMAATKAHKEAKMSKHGHQSKHAAHGGGRGWFLHVGSTGCEAASPTMSPSSCKAQNRISVQFDQFNATTNTLVIDPANVLAQVDLKQNTPQTAPGCMSSPRDPECETVFALLGLSGTATEQKLVSVR